jgi:hypothetical protein
MSNAFLSLSLPRESQTFSTTFIFFFFSSFASAALHLSYKRQTAAVGQWMLRQPTYPDGRTEGEKKTGVIPACRVHDRRHRRRIGALHEVEIVFTLHRPRLSFEPGHTQPERGERRELETLPTRAGGDGQTALQKEKEKEKEKRLYFSKRT